MKRKPLSRIRSRWTEDPTYLDGMRDTGHVEPDARYWMRNVHDGRLRVIAGTIPGLGLHLSISHVNQAGDPDRYPTWDEIADARDQLLDPEREYVMYLPRQEEYVAVHPTTFHLHEACPDAVVEINGRRYQMALCATEANDAVLEPVSGLPLAVLAPWSPEEWVAPVDGDPELSEGGGTVTALPPPPGGTDADTHQEPPQDGR